MKLSIKQKICNKIYNTLRRLGIKETRELMFSDLIDAVKKEAADEKFIEVSVSYNTFQGITLKGYYHGNTHHEGKTIEEVIEKLRGKGPEQSPIKEAVII